MSTEARGHNIFIGLRAGQHVESDGAAHHNILIGVDAGPDIGPGSTASYCIGIGERALEGVIDGHGIVEIAGVRLEDKTLAEDMYAALRKFIDLSTEGWLERMASDAGAS
jgi:hypothetical protein